MFTQCRAGVGADGRKRQQTLLQQVWSFVMRCQSKNPQPLKEVLEQAGFHFSKEAVSMEMEKKRLPVRKNASTKWKTQHVQFAKVACT